MFTSVHDLKNTAWWNGAVFFADALEKSNYAVSKRLSWKHLLNRRSSRGRCVLLKGVTHGCRD